MYRILFLLFLYQIMGDFRAPLKPNNVSLYRQSSLPSYSILLHRAK